MRWSIVVSTDGGKLSKAYEKLGVIPRDVEKKLEELLASNGLILENVIPESHMGSVVRNLISGIQEAKKKRGV